MNSAKKRSVQRASLLSSFYEKCQRDKISSLAASLAFYTALSLAPILILFLTFSASLSPGLQEQFINHVNGLVGSEASQAIRMIIENAQDRPDLSSLESLFGLATLFLSASFIFSLVYRYLPSRKMYWRQAVLSGCLTSVFFTLGKQLIGLYLGNSALNSSYGASGSIIVLLVWVYYSSLVTLVSAELSAFARYKSKKGFTHDVAK